jgi:hypothetical protein
MIIAAQFNILKAWKLPKYSFMDEWVHVAYIKIKYFYNIKFAMYDNTEKS